MLKIILNSHHKSLSLTDIHLHNIKKKYSVWNQEVSTHRMFKCAHFIENTTKGPDITKSRECIIRITYWYNIAKQLTPVKSIFEKEKVVFWVCKSSFVHASSIPQAKKEFNHQKIRPTENQMRIFWLQISFRPFHLNHINHRTQTKYKQRLFSLNIYTCLRSLN